MKHRQKRHYRHSKTNNPKNSISCFKKNSSWSLEFQCSPISVFGFQLLFYFCPCTRNCEHSIVCGLMSTASPQHKHASFTASLHFEPVVVSLTVVNRMLETRMVIQDANCHNGLVSRCSKLWLCGNAIQFFVMINLLKTSFQKDCTRNPIKVPSIKTISCSLVVHE